MSLKSMMDAISARVAEASADDLPGLVELHDLLSDIGASDELSDERLTGLSKEAAERVQGVVMRETDSVDDDMAFVLSSIEQVQEGLKALLAEFEEPGASDGAEDAVTEPEPEPEPEPVPEPEAVDAEPEPDPTPANTDPDFEPDEELLEAWLPSVGDTLNDIEGLLLVEDPSQDDIAELRRLVHTLKGECGVVSAHNAQKMFHEAESAVDRAIDADAGLPTDELFAMLDWVKRDIDAVSGVPSHEIEIDQEVFQAILDAPILEQASASTTEPEPAHDADVPVGPVVMDCEVDETVREFVGEAKEHFASAEEALLQLENTPDDLEQVNTVFRAFHTIKGVAGLLNMGPIVEVAHEAEFLLDKARNGEIEPSPPFCALALEASDMLAELIGMFEGGAAPTRARMHDLIERLKKARSGEIPMPVKAATPAPVSETNGPAPSNGKAGGNTKRADHSVKVNTQRLDSLLDMVGELVIGQQMIVQDPHIDAIQDQRTVRNLGQTSKIIRDLQEVAMSLRMVTLRGTFQKMARLVRDLGAKSGKSIKFHIDGEDTELDRNVVEEIGDPLVHMVRNACDHGVEPPEERAEAGKPEQGNLSLRAMHRGGSIVIELEDDGRGLKREKILGKAIERAVVSEREAEEMSDTDVYNLIFAAGFSTADKVTDISGRGVGMDVVRRNIEALRGKVEIRSTPGKGSTFVLSLPLTMAIIDGMIVRVGNQRYVIPTLSIEQSFRPTPEQLNSTMGRGEAVLIRGNLLPIYRLNRMFDLDEGAESFDDSLLVVVEFNDQRCCLLVDELLGQQQVVIKSLGGFGRLPGVSGGAILGDGRVALILDVGGLFTLANSSPPQPVAS